MFNPEKQASIPTEFTLFGHKYSVCLQDDLFENEGIYGDADEDLKMIRLQNVGDVVRKYEENGKVHETKVKITKETLIETFFHEVVHIMLDASNEVELSENEKFVNIMGKAWLEIYLSSAYEKSSK